jgi:hypothetical protein
MNGKTELKNDGKAYGQFQIRGDYRFRKINSPSRFASKVSDWRNSPFLDIGIPAFTLDLVQNAAWGSNPGCRVSLDS